MKTTLVPAMTFVFLLISAPVVHGDYTGLVVVREFSSQMTAAGVRDVFRVYAEFTNPTDRVDSWYGNAEHPFTIQNVLADGVTLGSGFTNFGGSSGTLPPEIPGTIRDWDTWATIGIANGDEAWGGLDASVLSMFPVFISGNNVTSSVGSISLPNNNAQGLANWRISGQDTALRVLLMQLVVNVGEHVRGTINLSGQIGAPGSYTSFDAIDQTFNSVPGPGCLAVMLFSMLIRKRRRREPGLV